MRYYSESTGTTYIKGIHQTMPEDAVEISDELFDSVIASPPPGKVRGHKDGLPFLMDAPPPTADQLAMDERKWRDAELPLSDGVVARHRDQIEAGVTSSLEPDQYKALQAYRQALRNWPEGAAFPDSTKRPVAPDWLATLASK